MPNYAYKCDKGHEFDELQTIHEGPLTSCKIRDRVVVSKGGPEEIETVRYVSTGDKPECGAPVERVISRVSFSFKGGAPTKKFYTRG